MKTKLRFLVSITLILLFSVTAFAQTAGTMTFTFTSVQQGTKTKQINAEYGLKMLQVHL